MSLIAWTEDPFSLVSHASPDIAIGICHEHVPGNRLTGKNKNGVRIYAHETACLREISMSRPRRGKPNQDVKPSPTFLDMLFSNAWSVTAQQICGGEIVRLCLNILWVPDGVLLKQKRDVTCLKTDDSGTPHC